MATTKAKTQKVTRVRKPATAKKTTRPVAKKQTPSTAKKAVYANINLESLSEVVGRLELEAEKFARKLIERAEEASIDLRSGLEDLIERVRTNGLYTIAADKKDEFEREIRRLAEDVVDRAKDAELLPFNGANRDRIINEAKRNFEDIRDRVNAKEWVARARVSASNTKDQVLNILSIPSHGEIVKLQKKISSLEKRLSTLHRKAA